MEHEKYERKGYDEKYHRHQKIINQIDNNFRHLNNLQRIVTSYFDKMSQELQNQSLDYYLDLMNHFNEYTLIKRENKIGQSTFLTDSLYGLQMKLLELFGIYGHFEEIENKIIWSEKISRDIIFNRKYVYRQIFKTIGKYENNIILKINQTFDEKMHEAVEDETNGE